MDSRHYFQHGRRCCQPLAVCAARCVRRARADVDAQTRREQQARRRKGVKHLLLCVVQLPLSLAGTFAVLTRRVIGGAIAAVAQSRPNQKRATQPTTTPSTPRKLYNCIASKLACALLCPCVPLRNSPLVLFGSLK